MFALATAVLGLAASTSAHKSLSVSVSNPSTADVDGLKLTTTISNTGDETLKLVNDPRTPLSSWATNTFAVSSDDGTVPAFTGVKVRYIPSVAVKSKTATFTVLEPGQSVDVTHEVGRYYNFTNAGAGNFHFEPVNLFTEVKEDGELGTIIAETAAAKVSLAGKLASTEPLSTTSLGGAEHHSVKRATYSSCTSTRQTQTNSAISAAANLAARSLSHLNSNPSGSTLQTTWYGTFSSSRYSATKTSFTRLQTYPAGWKYDCTCTDSGTYAYVYPSQYGTVYLCGYFWQAPATGSGSRADTIIHEGTHFTQVLGTDDYAYGESACKSLAKSNPTNAVYNADNHAFFSDYA